MKWQLAFDLVKTNIFLVSRKQENKRERKMRSGQSFQGLWRGGWESIVTNLVIYCFVLHAFLLFYDKRKLQINQWNDRKVLWSHRQKQNFADSRELLEWINLFLNFVLTLIWMFKKYVNIWIWGNVFCSHCAEVSYQICFYIYSLLLFWHDVFNYQFV